MVVSCSACRRKPSACRRWSANRRWKACRKRSSALSAALRTPVQFSRAARGAFRPRNFLAGLLRQLVQKLPQVCAIRSCQGSLERRVCFLPNGQRAYEQQPACRSQHNAAAAHVSGIEGGGNQSPALQRLECSGERRPVHREEGRYRAHARRRRTVQGHHERELAVGEPEGLERAVEASSQRSGGSMCAQAEAGVPDVPGHLGGEGFGKAAAGS